MFSALSINGRLGLTMSLLSALLIGTGVVGLFGMSSSNDANRLTYSVRLVKAIDISDMMVNVARERTSLDRTAIAPGSADAKLMYAKTDEVQATAMKAWNHYLQLPHDAEEGRLADTTGDLLRLEQEELAKFRAATERGDHDEIAAQAVRVGTTYTQMQNAADALKSDQLAKAKLRYEEAERSYNQFFVGAIVAIAVGVLAALLSWVSLRRAVLGPVRQALQHFSEIEAGDLRHRIEITSRDEMGRLLEGLSSMQQSLVGTVSSVRSGSDAIAVATREIAAGNADLSARTESQAASLEETAASAEQLTGTVKQNADNAREASTLATNASDIAHQGHEVVSRVIGTMSEISESSAKISEIIALIDGIAFQTNILALNAAVEAARAGEQGRGFAVVAGEVRSLAQRSSSAAKDIKSLIVDSVDRIGTGSAQVEEAGRTMGQIIDAVTRVNSIMDEISAASQEQSQGIGQVAQAVNQMDQVTQQNAALVEEASAAAQSLLDQARTLEQAVAIFKLPAADRSVSHVSTSTIRSSTKAQAEPVLA